MQDLGVPVRWLRSGTALGRARELRRHLRESPPDLVVSSVYEADIVSRLARMGRRRPTGVSTIINSQYGPSRLRWDRAVSRPKLRAVQALDAVTAHLAGDRFHAITAAAAEASVARLRLDPERVRVVPRGRDRARLGEPSASRREQVRRELGLDDDRRVLLTVGRREYQKGHEHMVRALPAVVEAHPDVVWLLAGRTGAASTATDELIRDLGLEDHVRRLGHRDDVGDLMVASDLFVFPSLWEGFGGVIAEAMALSLPIVNDLDRVAEEMVALYRSFAGASLDP